MVCMVSRVTLGKVVFRLWFYIYIHKHMYICVWTSNSSPSSLHLLSGKVEQTLQKTHFHPLVSKGKYCSFQKDLNGKQSCFLLERLIRWNLYRAAALVTLESMLTSLLQKQMRPSAPLLALLVPAFELGSSDMSSHDQNETILGFCYTGDQCFSCKEKKLNHNRGCWREDFWKHFLFLILVRK